MIFDDSDQDSKLFLLSPSRSSLKENEDVASRILSGLAFRNASLFGRLSGAVEQHGVETVSDVVVHVLKLLSNLLAGKQIDFEVGEDDLLESLDFGWQLSSPLSGKPKVHFNIRQQSIRRQQLQVGFPFQDDDGIKTITHHMEEAPQIASNKDKVVEREQEVDDPVKKAQNIPAGSPVAHQAQVQASPGKEEKLLENIDRGTGFQTIMRVAALPHDTGATGNRVSQGERGEESRASSVSNSRRISITGSLYTTDSDDDSLSTGSQTSLLVAVSEGQPEDYSEVSSSADGSEVLTLESESMEPVDVVCDFSFRGGDQSEEFSKQAEIPFPSENLSVEEYHQDVGDDVAEDKLPICSSVVLSRGNSCSENDMSQESFYAPEMWTYSDSNEFEAHALSRSAKEQQDEDSFLKSLSTAVDDERQKEADVKVVRVVMKSSFEDEAVFVSVQLVPEGTPGEVTNSLMEAGPGLKKEEKRIISEAPEKTLVIQVIPPEKRPEAARDDPEAHGTVDILAQNQADSVQNTAVLEDKQETSLVEGNSGVSQNSYGVSLEKLTAESLEAAAEGIPGEGGRGGESSENNNPKLSNEEHTEVAATEGDKGYTEGLAGATEADSDVELAGEAEESLTGVANLTEEESECDITSVDTGKSETAAKLHLDPATIQDSELHSKCSEAAGPESLLAAPHSATSAFFYNAHSGSIPYSGSLSLRSDSSNTSTRSFAFPILSAEWTSSPVKMPPPERMYSRHRRLSWRSLCCCSSVR